MDRQTRKANFKKLQQPANPKLRTTRSSKTDTVTMTLSDYFDSPGSTQESTSLPDPDDLFAEPKNKKSRQGQGQGQDKVKPKKAPKLKGGGTARRGRTTTRGRGKQPVISEFLRNEQLFSEVTAQHCLADNFSPDDIEMALALSKSEAEKHGILRLQDTQDVEGDKASEEVVDLLDDMASGSTDSIRRKLQKYGFRTAAKEEYNMLALGALPPMVSKRGKRFKWANKFTPLTLRNPVEQQKKLEQKVAALMAQQVRTKLPLEKALPLELTSAKLQRLQSTVRIVHEPTEEPITNPSIYYVEGLFEVSQMPVDHLLKNWDAIEGRDLSPKRQSEASISRGQKLEQVYAELEAFFGEAAEQRELDELEMLVADNMTEEEEEEAVAAESPLKEQPNRSIKMLRGMEKSGDTEEKVEGLEYIEILTENKENMEEQPENKEVFEEVKKDKGNFKKEETVQQDITRNINEVIDLSENLIKEDTPEASKQQEKPSHESSNTLSLPGQSIRCTSPDLFADSDEDVAEEPFNSSIQVYKNASSTDINCYEIYSSDEVKTSTTTTEEIKIPAPLLESFVDLTQDSPEILNFNNAQEILNLSQVIELQDPLNTLNSNLVSDQGPGTSTTFPKDSPALPTMSFQMEDSFNLILTNSLTLLPNTSFQKATATTPSSLKESSLSTDLKLNAEHSFKSSLSWQSNSLTDKPASICSHSDVSIDLTQDNEDEDNDGALLSDDEINYSIWKADKTQRQGDEEFLEISSDECEVSPMLSKRKTLPYFRTLEDLDAFLDAPAAPIETSKSHSPNKSVLSRERAEFGIMDAAPSQPMTLSQMPSDQFDASKVHIDWTEASFLDTPPVQPRKRYSSSSSKFQELLHNLPEDREKNPASFDFDEFDKLVFDSSKESEPTEHLPSGLERLLQGEINMDSIPTEKVEPVTIPATSEQVQINGKTYTVRVCNEPKPDYFLMSEDELLQQLYKFGIKPLKRKHAIKLLEFIYNQTHPIMLPVEQPPAAAPQPLPRSKSTPLAIKSRPKQLPSGSNNCLTPTELNPNLDSKFRDACGAELLRFSQAVPPALCDDFECYVLQTNVTKKTPQPLLPLHIAWHNLLCGNPSLHESVLMYEPIDLQEIYLYLKQQLGLRFDPKDLKCFFDRRCIIFRYELAPPAKQQQRHVRKKPKSKAGLKT